jgi:type II secretory pathway pseudopilin PulG
MRRGFSPGMTLLEVLIATAILVFGVVAVLGVVMSAQSTHQRAIDETVAVQVAQSILAEWRMQMDRGLDLPVSMEDPKKMDFDDMMRHADYPDYRYVVRYTEISAPGKLKSGEPPLGREYMVEVHVFWMRQGGPRSVSFHTVMLYRGG